MLMLQSLYNQSIIVIFLVLSAMFSLLPALSAQNYQTSVGLRFSPYYGVTVKHFMNQSRALEGLLSTRRGGVGITGLYEIHSAAFSTPGLSWFGGIGGHLNFFHKNYRSVWDWDDKYDNWRDRSRQVSIGVDMILGLEYTLSTLPFNLGIDWKPALNLIGDHGFSADQLALSFRFILE